MPWRLTVRVGPRVEKAGFEDLAPALAALERRARELAGGSSRKTVDLKFRTFERAAQVAARLEVSGPQRLLPRFHGGVDVRGDGSLEPYVGSVRRRPLQPRGGESAYDALRRAASRAGTRST